MELLYEISLFMYSPVCVTQTFVNYIKVEFNCFKASFHFLNYFISEYIVYFVPVLYKSKQILFGSNFM